MSVTNLNYFDKLPDDLTRLIYTFDSTYHHEQHKKIINEINGSYYLLKIILTAHYTSTSDNPVARINSFEHQQTKYPPIKTSTQQHKYPIRQLFYKLFLQATTN
tara:strand:+ start:167 stop:478 length:312 start_codon:yes stop_codon:yes gene_type:complete